MEPTFLRVLVVDDSAGDRALIRVLLCQATEPRFEVVEANSAFSGLLRLEKNDIDCVLLDIRMPAISGWEAYREISERFSKVAVVMMSGFADETSRLALHSVSSPDLVTKGCMTMDTLVRAIRHSFSLRRQVA